VHGSRGRGRGVLDQEIKFSLSPKGSHLSTISLSGCNLSSINGSHDLGPYGTSIHQFCVENLKNIRKKEKKNFCSISTTTFCSAPSDQSRAHRKEKQGNFRPNTESRILCRCCGPLLMFPFFQGKRVRFAAMLRLRPGRKAREKNQGRQKM
jgi:hypothetical protein